MLDFQQTEIFGVNATQQSMSLSFLLAFFSFYYRLFSVSPMLPGSPFYFEWRKGLLLDFFFSNKTC